MREDDSMDYLAEMHFTQNQDTDRVKCRHPQCNEAGSVKCVLPGMEEDEHDLEEYFCPEHAGEQGYCHVCGTFIAGLDCSLFGTLCDHCRDQLEY